MSVEVLDFDIRARLGENFEVNAATTIPLQGITAIKGPSGSGKTSLLRALAGLGPVNMGHVRFGDQEWLGQSTWPVEKRRIGFVFQSPFLFPHMSVRENVAYGAKRRGVSDFDDIIDALDLGPMLSRTTTALSGGEMRRVALARALASDPKILFLDEPLVGLDADSKADLLTYIARAVTTAKIPALYVTHGRDEIAMLADRVLGMEAGKITGWLAAPQRIEGLVKNVVGDQMELWFGPAGTDEGVQVTMPAMARIGESVGLAVSEGGHLISTEHPGDSNAGAVFPGTVVSRGEDLALSVFEQDLFLPLPADAKVGDGYYLSILKMLPRPRPDESF